MKRKALPSGWWDTLDDIYPLVPKVRKEKPPRKKPPLKSKQAVLRGDIFRRFKINRWAEQTMLNEKARTGWKAGQGNRYLTDEEAKRLVKVCAEFAGSRLYPPTSNDRLIYGHHIMRRRGQTRQREASKRRKRLAALARS